MVTHAAVRVVFLVVGVAQGSRETVPPNPSSGTPPSSIFPAQSFEPAPPEPPASPVLREPFGAPDPVVVLPSSAGEPQAVRLDARATAARVVRIRILVGTGSAPCLLG